MRRISRLYLRVRRNSRLVLPPLLVLFAFGCCPNPSNIDVTPTCPGGTRAASGLNINVDFSKIRPIGGTIQLNIQGTRLATDQCFQPGAQASFLVPNLQGTTTGTQAEPNLADGSWSLVITALSGGDQNPVKLSPTLQPGVTHTLTVSGNASGDLIATFM